jgi:aspartyl-tRNA(Asn)/glutamyl-tRNA(Gln) amidotransferase subunit B
MEIVGEPDIRSPEEARQYLMKLRTILQFLSVSSGNMEEGSFRCDANISMRPSGSSNSAVKVEVKNMNSFRAVYRALGYEEERQGQALEEGGRLVQETRGWVEEKGVTVSQRSKEYAHDYRYFPEPDLPPLAFSRQWVEELRSRLPELPEARRDGYMAQYGLSRYDASLITSSKAMADYFEACLKPGEGRNVDKRAKVVSNWLLGDFTRLLNLANIEIDEARAKVPPERLMEMLDLMDEGTLSGAAAKTVLEEMFDSGGRAAEIIAEKGLTQISDAKDMEGIVTAIIAENAPAVADFKKGKERALTFLVGQVMRQTRGRANATVVDKLLKEKLDAS